MKQAHAEVVACLWKGIARGSRSLPGIIAPLEFDDNPD